MPISRKYQCVFVHIPKTGGQSIESVLLQLHNLTWERRAPLLMQPNPDPARGPERLAHLKACEYVKYGYMDRTDFEQYFKFAFVRNPWDRLVSEYRYRKLEGRVRFESFVTNSFGQVEDYSDASRHIIPQVQFVTDEHGEIIVDFIGRFERLDQDFQRVASQIGLDGVHLPHRNSAAAAVVSKVPQHVNAEQALPKHQPRPYQDYYDDNLEQSVADYYAEDIERFGYAFDGSFNAG